MNPTTFIIGNKEFTCVRMNAFAANKILLRIQKIAFPILGSVMTGNKSILDMDVKKAAEVIAEHLTEDIFENIVFPMFSESKVYCNELKKFVRNETELNQVFTSEELFTLYELIFEVARFQYKPFFEAMMSRFGEVTESKTPA